MQLNDSQTRVSYILDISEHRQNSRTHLTQCTDMPAESMKKEAKTHLKQFRGWQFCMDSMSACTLISQNRSFRVLVDFQYESFQSGAFVSPKYVFETTCV